jgi:alpha-ketoglutarate-dependent taurine dioxygenase
MSDPVTPRFERVEPAPVHLALDRLVTTEPLSTGGGLPLVVRPVIDDVDFAEWARSDREWIEEQLADAGALLFRGFDVRGADEFERAAQALCDSLYEENAEHTPVADGSPVQVPVAYAPDRELLWHNENSFNHQWPRMIWFGCVHPATEGGETPIVDSRKVYELLDPEIRETFADKQIMYVRNYGKGPGLEWQTVFNTTDKAEVENRCREARMDFEWTANDGLRTSAVRPAVLAHPKTGEMSWFNQAQHWHLSCLDDATRKSLTSVFAERDLPRNCYYGDGSPIADSVMNQILALYQQLEDSFSWRRNDIMLLDNVLTAHARNPFAGERKLLVAMGEMLSYAEADHESD